MSQAEFVPFETRLRRFNQEVKRDGILQELRIREAFEKPSMRRKRKSMAARARSRRTVVADNTAGVVLVTNHRAVPVH